MSLGKLLKEVIIRLHKLHKLHSFRDIYEKQKLFSVWMQLSTIFLYFTLLLHFSMIIKKQLIPDPTFFKKLSKQMFVC